MTSASVLVFARAAGLMLRAPGFAHPSVPPAIRVGLALALTAAVAPVTASPALAGAMVAPAVAGEVVLGAAIGFGASLMYDAAYFAGRALDDYVGVRGSVPTAAVASSQGFGRLWASAFLAGFFLLDGWVPVVRTFAASFERVAPGALVSAAAWDRFALALPATMLHLALAIAGPAIAAALVVHVALAAVTRVVPRFGSFSLAFPVVFAAALVVTIVTVPWLAPLAGHPLIVAPW